MDKNIYKFYIKSNKKCSICNKYVENIENIIATKTKKGSYIIAHSECLIKRI